MVDSTACVCVCVRCGNWQDKHWRLIGWGKIRRGTKIEVTAMSREALQSSTTMFETETADSLDAMADSEAGATPAAASPDGDEEDTPAVAAGGDDAEDD